MKKRNLKLRLKKLTLTNQSEIESPTVPECIIKAAFKCQKLYQVTPLLFMSSYKNAKDASNLRTNGISHVINLTSHHCPNLHSNQVTYSSFALSDNVHFDLLSNLDEILKTIKRKNEENKKVLIHCRMGISRAPSVVIALLMKYSNMKLDSAFEFLQEINPKVSPNLGFLMQLKKLEELIFN